MKFLSLTFIFIQSISTILFAANNNNNDSIYGNEDARQNFDLESGIFINNIALELRDLNIESDSSDIAEKYEEILERAAQLRLQLAQSSESSNSHLFGLERFKNESKFRADTDIGTDKYNAWRLKFNKYLKNYLEHLSLTGKRSLEKSYGPQIQKYELLKSTAGEYYSSIKELATLDSLLEAEAEHAIMRVCMAFPKMESFPSVDDVNFVVLKIIESNIQLATYVFAFDGGQSDTLSDRGKRGLDCFKDDKCPHTGALIIHSPLAARDHLRKGAQDAFEKFILEIKKENVDNSLLITLAATFRWYKSHEMRFCRGSLAVAEWIEAAMIKASDHKISRNGKWESPTYADSMAFCCSLSEFIEKYISNNQLI